MMKYPGIPRKIILAVTQGRTGTKFLSHVLAHYPGVASFHEHKPSFVGHLQDFRDEPVLAEEFLRSKKIPVIAQYGEYQAYADISHLWCKGPLQAWIRLGIEPLPDLILLDRPLRAVALSMLRLRTIPGRTQSGLRWYSMPCDHAGASTSRWPEHWTDYQFCYAYSLVVEQIKEVLGKEVQAAGGAVIRTSAQEISTWRGFYRLRKGLSLPLPRPRHLYSFAFLKSRRLNRQPEGKDRVIISSGDLDVQEEEVRNSLPVSK